MYIYIYISGCGFKSHSGQLSIATSNNPSVVKNLSIDCPCIKSIYTHIN